MATIEAVRELALTLPRNYEALVRGRVDFRVGRIVYLAFSHDEEWMGFGFAKEEREALIASDPETFVMSRRSDQRYNWVVVRLSVIDGIEMQNGGSSSSPSPAEDTRGRVDRRPGGPTARCCRVGYGGRGPGARIGDNAVDLIASAALAFTIGLDSDARWCPVH